ncbi:MAG: 3-phosphoserine/phosphohydroxythreonine transaminase [Planctomycetes bacterium]|nr:3-phosphoserine/phosphohydroxythreonine transaminase [Planctomycetota bacterium]
MTNRAHNFNPGPAALPLEVLKEVQEELLDFKGSGMSILEHSHRGKDYEAVHNQAQALFAELLGLTPDYKVVFLGGGASTQFYMVPQNLITGGKKADYVNTGSWAEKAIKEAKKFGDVALAHDVKASGGYTYIPTQDQLKLRPDAVYLHITTNNTIEGTQYHAFPQAPAGVPLVADMSSDFLWRKFDPRPFGLIYAGAQKNLGPAGVTALIIRQDLAAKFVEGLPTMCNLKKHMDENSLYNTPPVFAIYVTAKVLEWIKRHGGLEAMEKRNLEKAKLLYDTIDAHPAYFKCPVRKDSRSMMNVVWRLPNEQLEEKFVKESKAAGLVGLKGHRSVGGLRASIYNAVPHASVKALVDFMTDFMKKNG